MSSRRQRQVADLIQEELSLLLARRVRDPRLEGVTVTGVEVPPDLRIADVYVTKLGDEQAKEEALEGLRAASGYLRRELAPLIRLRYMPELRFHLDNTFERGQRIEQLLRQIAEEEKPAGEPAPEEPKEAEEPNNDGD